MGVSRAQSLFISATSLALAMGACSAPAHALPADQPFISLARAYADRDAPAAARAYSVNAEVIYAYDGVATSEHRGRTAIEQSFVDFFDQVSPDDLLDLNFRIVERQGDQASGIYRLRIGSEFISFGRFAVAFDQNGLFLSDRSTSADLIDFEEAAGPVMIGPQDEVLDAVYYRLLTGRYRLPSGCHLVVTRSVVRLFVRNTCDQSWRGLQRVSGLQWTSGPTLLSDQVEAEYHFDRAADAPSTQIEIHSDNRIVQALRDTPYALQPVQFTAPDGTRLTGTLYLPNNLTARASATVLVHGSGPQDRDGYASIIAVLADSLAAEGRMVLTYDKRGSGGSGGDGDNAGFDLLAADAQAAMGYLRNRPEVDPARVGLAGSSQAGWVIATAIRDGAAPADVFLLGAAGAAFSVREQNLYNTQVRMTCNGISAPLRQMALDQQAAFFDAIQNPGLADRLDQLTADAAQHAEIRDWLFPNSSGLNQPGAWFAVLDPAFDPLPIWRDFGGRAVLVFSDHDDATDTDNALARLAQVGITGVRLPDSQHLGLNAADVCDAELGDQTHFSPELFATLAAFARSEP